MTHATQLVNRPAERVEREFAQTGGFQFRFVIFTSKQAILATTPLSPIGRFCYSSCTHAAESEDQEGQQECLPASSSPATGHQGSWTVPRKGRLVQPRHIFPWIAAPYIEMLRILWRIEGYFLLPIKYLRAWTVSAIFGVVGVLFSIALFIPRLAETQLQASPDLRPRMVITPYDMPLIAEENLVLPMQSGRSHLEISFRPFSFREPFDQNRLTRTESRSPKRSIPRTSLHGDSWREYRRLDTRPHEVPIESYVHSARTWEDRGTPQPGEYIYDPRMSGAQDQTSKSPTLLIEKRVPARQSPHELLISVITVTNNGSEPVESAIVREVVEDISRVIDCVPEAMRSADSRELIWNLSHIQPQERRELTITIQPDGYHNVSETTEVEFSSTAVIAETMIQQRTVAPDEPQLLPDPVKRPASVGRPKLVVDFDPPKTVKVGEEVEAHYTITNVGTADATGIRLLVEVPPSLRHRFGDLVEHKISRLAPKESRRALFAALAEGAGRMSLNWTLEADDLPNQSDSEWLAVTAAPAPTLTTPSGGKKSSIPPARSTVPPADDVAVPDESSIPREKSSIPGTGPNELEEPVLTTPEDNPILDELNPDELNPGDPTPESLDQQTPSQRLSPSLNTDVPSAAFGTRPSSKSSTIPNWTRPASVANPGRRSDPDTLPIDPELTPESDSDLNTPDLLMEEPAGLEGDGPALPGSFPADEITDGIKPQ